MRYDDMVAAVNEMISVGGELDDDQQTIFNTAYMNAVGRKRASLRAIADIEAKCSGTNTAVIRHYSRQIEYELDEVCRDVLGALNTKLIPGATRSLSKVFFYKMKGDYSRYIAESGPSEPRDTAIAVAEEAYEAASRLAENELAAAHPLRLGVALNFSVFYYEIQKSHTHARSLAEQAYDDALAELDFVSEDAKTDSVYVMRLLLDNLKIWRTSGVAGLDCHHAAPEAPNSD